jgi:hypothetical protein
MATYSGAFGNKAGFNQNAGGYFLVISTIAPANAQAITTASSGSGGAFAPAVLGAYNWAADGGFSTLLTAGNVLKDMGRTVITSAGRTYRKFQLVNSVQLSTFGVTGSAPVAPSAGYASFYLEVGREGSAVTTGNMLARAF